MLLGLALMLWGVFVGSLFVEKRLYRWIISRSEGSVARAAMFGGGVQLTALVAYGFATYVAYLAGPEGWLRPTLVVTATMAYIPVVVTAAPTENSFFKVTRESLHEAGAGLWQARVTAWTAGLIAFFGLINAVTVYVMVFMV